jgi:hypothetical protein
MSLGFGAVSQGALDDVGDATVSKPAAGVGSTSATVIASLGNSNPGAGVGETSAVVVWRTDAAATGNGGAFSHASVVARGVFVDPSRLFGVQGDVRRFSVGDDDRHFDVPQRERMVA